MPVMISCKRCGKGFNVKPNQATKRVYCSMECMKIAYTNEPLKKICEVCNEPFEVPGYNSRKNARFCSKKCMGEGMSKENHWNYKHGQRWLPEDQKNYREKYYRENKEKAHQRAFLNKARQRSGKQVKGSHTFEEWQELIKKHDFKCYYCKERMAKEDSPLKWTRDHIIPLSRGGSDDINNIVPSCKSCNSSKGDKTLEEWERVTVIETTL
jgi:5-methylcytosine-specific restriction endonuclease McrA